MLNALSKRLGMFSALFLGLTIWFGHALGASAHAELVSSNPVSNSHIDGPVESILLTFGEGVKHMNTMTIKDDAGNVYDVKDYAYNGAQVVVNLTKPITQGKISMNWVALSEDGHNSPGDLTFTVGNTTAQSTDQNKTTAQPSANHSNTMITTLLGVLLVVIIIGFIFVLRRKK